MFALHITEPGHFGFPEKHSIVLTKTRRQRDKLVEYVRRQAHEFGEFKRKCPHDIVPSSLAWYTDTTAEPITMKEARALIDGDDVMFESKGWDHWYNYTECEVYKYEIHPLGRYGWKDGRHYYKEVAA